MGFVDDFLGFVAVANINTRVSVLMLCLSPIGGDSQGRNDPLYARTSSLVKIMISTISTRADVSGWKLLRYPTLQCIQNWVRISSLPCPLGLK